jgi:hypothetical protein
MGVTIALGEMADFAETLATKEFGEEERDYKWAVHIVLHALLTEPVISRDDLGSLLSELFTDPFPNMDTIGISLKRQAFVKAATHAFGKAGLRGAMANLCGGRFGLAQFSWIPRAVEFGLGPQIAVAFRDLVDESIGIAQRVDQFRKVLYDIQGELEHKGGFLPKWHQFTPTLSFVATILTAYDPTRYTYYSKGALRHGYDHYSPTTPWPKGTMGEIYAEVCNFVQSVAEELKSHDVPVRDLIDAQSFVWLSFGKTAKQELPLPGPVAGSGSESIDIELVVKDLAKAVYWPEARARKLVDLVQRWGQVLFQGPPGTGKTFVAETLARLLSGDEDSRLEVVQFHPSYAYEDFIEGIRPTLTEGSDLAYHLQKGVFLKLVDQAIEYAEAQYFLVVDELNRANLPRVFGELLYALEYRGPEHPFRLPYSGTQAYVPPNITLIGTMNTADRSIAHVDVAIRRRFRHLHFGPDTKVLQGWLTDHGLALIADQAVKSLDSLNAELLQLLDGDRLIGHTYLMRQDLGDLGLEAPWEDDIEPVLNEHLFGQPIEVARLREVFLGNS